MICRRSWTVAIFAPLLAVAAYLAPVDERPGSVKEVIPGVWFREGDIKNYGHCNNAIIEMKDYLIVVDANFPNGARAVIEDAKKLSPKPIRYVFDTHHHGDHAYGNAVWTKIGATTLAHAGVVEELKRYEPKAWQDTAKERKDVAELNLPTAEPPRQTFKDTFVLEDGTRRVEFHFFGWAHTRGDGFVFLPKERLLCTGDAVVNGPYNYTGQGYIGNWPNVVDRAARLNPRHVLPGHGASGGAEILAGQKQFFLELKSAVDRSRKAGKPVKGLAADLKLSPSVKNWVGDFFPSQVQDMYEELEQGKPHGEIVGGK